MTDSTFGSKSSKKEHKDLRPPLNSNKEFKGFGGSLALRTFLVTVIFLVIPLVVYCLVMYRYDSALKQADQAKSLNLVADVQIFMLEKLAAFQLENLELMTLYLKEGGFLEENNRAFADKALKNIKMFEGVQNIFVLKKDAENKVIYDLYSGEYDSMTSYEDIFLTPSLASSDYAITVDKKKLGKKSNIYFIKVLKRGINGEVLETLNLAISTQFFMNYLTDAQGYKDIYKVSLFMKNSHLIFEGEEPSLIGKILEIGPVKSEEEKALILKPLNRESNTYTYQSEGKKLYATILFLPYGDFHILISRTQYDYFDELTKFFYQTVFLFVCIIVFGGVGAGILIYLMATPLKNLCAAMTKVGNQDLTARYESSPYGFEINRIGELFNNMIQKLLYNLDMLQKRTIKQKILEQELQIGQDIQKSLVPTELPEVPGIEIQTVLIPADEVGGDFYDYFVRPSSPDEVFLVMGDTAGHGVFGCFYSLTMRSILRSLGSTMVDLKDIIIKSNQLFCKDSAESSVFVTAWIGSYNHKTQLLRYSSCGHPLGFLFRDNKLYKELTTPGIALGVIEDMEPVMDSVELKSGDTLIFVTDGLTETHNPNSELFGKQRFIETVEKYCSMPMLGLFENIIHEVEAFEVDPQNQEDDVTMVIIRLK